MCSNRWAKPRCPWRRACAHGAMVSTARITPDTGPGSAAQTLCCVAREPLAGRETRASSSASLRARPSVTGTGIGPPPPPPPAQAGHWPSPRPHLRAAPGRGESPGRAGWRLVGSSLLLLLARPAGPWGPRPCCGWRDTFGLFSPAFCLPLLPRTPLSAPTPRGQQPRARGPASCGWVVRGPGHQRSREMACARPTCRFSPRFCAWTFSASSDSRIAWGAGSILHVFSPPSPHPREALRDSPDALCLWDKSTPVLRTRNAIDHCAPVTTGPSFTPLLPTAS